MKLLIVFAFLTLGACDSATESVSASEITEVTGIALPGREAVQAAFDNACPDQPRIDYAKCVALDDPTEFECEYSLETWDLVEFPKVVIAADGDAFVLLEIPQYCQAQ